MRFRRLGRIALAAGSALGLGLGVIACGPSNTIDFLFATASKENPGQINVYAVDSESGALVQIPDSPYSSGGRNPVADVASPNGKNLYVINHDDNTVVEFAIGTDGKIYPQQTCNTPGTFPVQMAINSTGTYLYVIETYQPNYNVNIPGPGAIVVYPIDSTGQLGSSGSSCTPVANGNNSFFPVGDTPTAVNVLSSDNYVYAVNEGDATVWAFSVNSSTGALTFLASYSVGVAPNALASDPTDRFLYVTDGASNQVIGLVIQSNGTLTPMQAPFGTGNLPDSVVVDPRGQWVIVANYNSNTISSFAIDQNTGQLSAAAAGSPSFAVNTGPASVLIEPALGRYIYTANFLDNTVTGVYMNPSSGALSGVQNSPFIAAGQPTSLAAVTHGNHATQHTQP